MPMVYKSPAGRAAAALLDGIAPRYCVLCGMRSRRPLALCEACEEEIPRNRPACPRCALPMASATETCGACLRKPPPLRFALAARIYAEPVSSMVRAFKFGGDFSMPAVLAQLMAPAVAHGLGREARPDYLVPMPLHWWRRWRRGFNQSELLARALVRHPELQSMELRVHPGLCGRIRHTPAQTGLAAEERRRNMRDCFRCESPLAGLHLAIVDDVMTTGASANALAEALLGAGAERVDLWCCARTPEPGMDMR